MSTRILFSLLSEYDQTFIILTLFKKKALYKQQRITKVFQSSFLLCSRREHDTFAKHFNLLIAMILLSVLFLFSVIFLSHTNYFPNYLIYSIKSSLLGVTP